MLAAYHYTIWTLRFTRVLFLGHSAIFWSYYMYRLLYRRSFAAGLWHYNIATSVLQIVPFYGQSTWSSANRIPCSPHLIIYPSAFNALNINLTACSAVTILRSIPPTAVPSPSAAYTLSPAPPCRSLPALLLYTAKQSTRPLPLAEPYLPTAKASSSCYRFSSCCSCRAAGTSTWVPCLEGGPALHVRWGTRCGNLWHGHNRAVQIHRPFGYF